MEEVQDETGTTIAGVAYRGGAEGILGGVEGIILASDSRRTRKISGVRHIVSDRINKITNVGGNVAMGGSGKAFGVEAMSASMPICSNPGNAANVISDQIRGFHNRYLVAGLAHDGIELYHINRFGRIREVSPWFVIGSGSSFASAIIDYGYSYFMEQDEAAELARKAVCVAAACDGATGGFFRAQVLGLEGPAHSSWW